MHKRTFTHLLLLLLTLFLSATNAQEQKRQTTTPLQGERIDQLLSRNGIDVSHSRLFIALNWPRLTDDNMLMLGFSYSLPTKQDIANADKIISEAQSARSEAKQSKTSVPKKEVPKYGIFPIFGKQYERVDYVDYKLSGATYYLSSGHGGPDPGAQATYKGKIISEDEYAYDVILRMARQLLSHRARVHVIIRDPDDGIRDEEILENDDHETCMGAAIPLDQIQRLAQRSDSINSLYARERSSGYCRSVFLHVDSRSKEKRIDIFFYHFMKSAKGERLAKILQNKMAEKYKKHQPYRGFGGEVSARNLYVLRETNPVGVFIEIGNIQNSQDMVRLAKPNNREAVARWITEGLIEDFQAEKVASK